MVFDPGGAWGNDWRGDADELFGVERIRHLVRVVASVQLLNDP
jgi:hypothetical protein